MAELTYRIATTIEAIDKAAWDALCMDAEAGIGMDRRFIMATERTFLGRSRFWHVLVYADGTTPVACTSFSTYGVDLAPLTDRRVQEISRPLRWIAPALFRTKVLFCGLPLFFGMPHLSFGLGAPHREIMEVLAHLARRFAAAERADLIVFKEFTPEQCRRLGQLEEYGYVPIETPAMYHFKPRSRNFEDYCMSLRSHYRYVIHRVQRRFDEAGCRHVRVSHPDDIARLYTDEVHGLYEDVAATAAIKVGCLPRAFVVELARLLPGQVSLSLVVRGDAVVGCSCILLARSKCHFLLCGFDRATCREGEVYFNLMHRDLAYAMSSGPMTDIEVGQTAEDFKARLGAEPVPLKIFVRAARPLPALILRVGLTTYVKGGYHPMPPGHHIYRTPVAP